MPIQPVSGEIQAQPLNNNFSFLDSKLNQVNGGPRETFTSESALITKYPSGSNSAMLVTDAAGANGYLYTWNGTAWTKGPLYQAQGVADRSISTGKLELGSVTRNVLQGVEKGINVYDRSKRTENSALGTDGSLVSNANYDVSEFIEVTSNLVTISYARSVFAVFYDGDKRFLTSMSPISEPTEKYTFSLPATAKYFRINIWREREHNFMIVFGDALPSSYQPFFTRLADYLPAENSVSVDELDQVTVSANLFNKSTAQKGKAVSEGNLIDNANYAVSDFIKIKPGQKYIATQARFLAASFFDKNMVYISELTTTDEVEKYTFNTPPIAYYLKFNAPIARLDEFMICEGDQLPIEFITYQKSIDWLVPKDGTVEKRHLEVDLQSAIDNIPDWSDKKIITFGDSITWYDGQPYLATHKESGKTCVGYQSWIREKLGATVVNMGWSGYTMQQILNVVRSTDLTDVDIVTLTSGANDWSQEIPVGVVATPKSQFDENTFAGAAQAAIEAILEKNSKVKLVLIAPIKGYHPISAHSTEWQIGSVVDDMLEQPDFYYDTLKKLADLYGCYFVDLRNLTGLNWFNYPEYLLDDPAQTSNKFVHPGNEYFERIAEVVIDGLKNRVGAGFK